jgi:hypothetical protein
MYQQLMQLHSQDVRGAGIDRGMALMASAFGTADQQRNMMEYAMRTPEDDRLRAFGQAVNDQAAMRQQQNAAQFQAGAAGALQQLGIVNDPATAQTIASNPQLAGQMLETHAGLQMAGAKEAQQKLIENQQGFGSADSKAAETLHTIDSLLNNPSALHTAIKYPGLSDSTTNEGYYGGALTVGQDAMTARAQLNQLKNQLNAKSLGESGMSRMAQMEFLKVGSSMTDIDSLKDPQAIDAELARVKDMMMRARANIQAAAGKEVDANLSGYAEPSYFDKKNPLTYTGATIAKGGAQPGTIGTSPGASSGGTVATVASPADAQKLPSGTKFVIPEGPRKGQIAQVP